MDELEKEKPEEAGTTADDATGVNPGEPGDCSAGQGHLPGEGEVFGASAPVRVKPDTLNRAIARFIDLLIALLFGMLPGYIGFFAALTYIGIADGLMGGRSIGKRIIGLRVYSSARSRPADYRDSILRNSSIGLVYIFSVVPLVGWLLAAAGLCFELILIIGSPEGRRLGDEIASTVVVEYGPERMDVPA